MEKKKSLRSHDTVPVIFVAKNVTFITRTEAISNLPHAAIFVSVN